MWNASLPWWEFVVRGIVVYIFLLIVLRITGRRQTGQLASFDLVLLLILSNAVQNAMNGGDNSLTGGLILAATLIAMHYLCALLTLKNRTLERLIDGTPHILIREGKVNERVMRSELLSSQDLASALRAAGCDDVAAVHMATMETNGQITVTLRTRRQAK